MDKDFEKTIKDFAGLLAPRKTVPRKSGPPAQPKKEKNNPSRFFDQYEQTRSSPSKSKSNLQNGSTTKLKSKGTKTKLSRYEIEKFESVEINLFSGLHQGDHWQLVVLELVPLQKNEQFDQNRLNRRSGQNLQVGQNQSQLQLYVPVHQKEKILKTINVGIC